MPCKTGRVAGAICRKPTEGSSGNFNPLVDIAPTSLGFQGVGGGGAGVGGGCGRTRRITSGSGIVFLFVAVSRWVCVGAGIYSAIAADKYSWSALWPSSAARPTMTHRGNYVRVIREI